MRVDEIFDDGPHELVKQLRDAIIDILTPLAAHGVPYITVQKVIDKLGDQHTGIEVDRALVMHVLDPQEVKLVTKIEGDKIYFSLPDENENAANQDEEQKNKEHVRKTAIDQAKDQIKAKNSPQAPLGN